MYVNIKANLAFCVAGLILHVILLKIELLCMLHLMTVTFGIPEHLE